MGTVMPTFAGMTRGLGRRLKERVVEIVPAGVGSHDQARFIGALPLLDLFFARDGCQNSVVALEIDEAVQRVFFRETVNGAGAMLMDAANEVDGDAGVERAVGAVGMMQTQPPLFMASFQGVMPA